MSVPDRHLSADIGVQERATNPQYPWSNRPLSASDKVSWQDVTPKDIAFLMHCIVKRESHQQSPVTDFEVLLTKYHLQTAAQESGLLESMYEAFLNPTDRQFEGIAPKAHTPEEYLAVLDPLFANGDLYTFLLARRALDRSRNTPNTIRNISPLRNVQNPSEVVSHYDELALLFYPEVKDRRDRLGPEIVRRYESLEDAQNTLKELVAEAASAFNWDAYAIDPISTIERFNRYVHGATQEIEGGNKAVRQQGEYLKRHHMGRGIGEEFEVEITDPTVDIEAEVLDAEEKQEQWKQIEGVLTELSPLARDVFLGIYRQGLSEQELAERFHISEMQVTAIATHVADTVQKALRTTNGVDQKVDTAYSLPRVERANVLWGKLADPAIKADLIERLHTEGFSLKERIIDTALQVVTQVHGRGMRLTNKRMIEAVKNRLSAYGCNLTSFRIINEVREWVKINSNNDFRGNNRNIITIAKAHERKLREKLNEMAQRPRTVVYRSRPRYQIFQAALDNPSADINQLVKNVRMAIVGTSLEKWSDDSLKKEIREMVVFLLNNGNYNTRSYNFWGQLSQSTSVIRLAYAQIRNEISSETKALLDTIFQVAQMAQGNRVDILSRLRALPEFGAISDTGIEKRLRKILTLEIGSRDSKAQAAMDTTVTVATVLWERKEELQRRFTEITAQHITKAEILVLTLALDFIRDYGTNYKGIYKKMYHYARSRVPELKISPHTFRREFEDALEKLLTKEEIRELMSSNLTLWSFMLIKAKELKADLQGRQVLIARNKEILSYAIQVATGRKDTTVELVHMQFPQFSREEIATMIKEGVYALFEEDERQRFYETTKSGVWDAIIHHPEIIEAQLALQQGSRMRAEVLQPKDLKLLRTALAVGRQLQREGVEEGTPKMVAERIFANLHVENGAYISPTQADLQTIARAVRRAVNIAYGRESYSWYASTGRERTVGWRWRLHRDELHRLMHRVDFPAFLEHLIPRDREKRQRILAIIAGYYPSGDTQPLTLREIQRKNGLYVDESILSRDLTYIKNVLRAVMTSEIGHNVSSLRN